MQELLPEEIMNSIKEIAIENNLIDFKMKVEEREFTGDNFLGNIFKVYLEGESNGNQINLPLIVKKSLNDLEARKCMYVRKYYTNEIYFYKTIAPILKQIQDKYNLEDCERFNVPRYFKYSLEDMSEFVILNDLSYDGFSMWERWRTLDREHIEIVVKNLARLHSLSFALKDDDPVLFDELTRNIPNTENYGKFIFEVTKNSIERIIPKLQNDSNRRTLIGLQKQIADIFVSCLDARETHPYNVICHGDSFRNNFLFKYKNSHVSDHILVDWQMIRFASPVTDLAYTFCLSTDGALRRQHLSSLLDLYYQTLSYNMIKMNKDIYKFYPRHIYEKHLKNIFKYAIIFGLMSIPNQLRKPGDELNVQEMSTNLNEGHLDVEINLQVLKRVEDLLTDFIKIGYI